MNAFAVLSDLSRLPSILSRQKNKVDGIQVENWNWPADTMTPSGSNWWFGRHRQEQRRDFYGNLQWKVWSRGQFSPQPNSGVAANLVNGVKWDWFKTRARSIDSVFIYLKWVWLIESISMSNKCICKLCFWWTYPIQAFIAKHVFSCCRFEMKVFLHWSCCTIQFRIWMHCGKMISESFLRSVVYKWVLASPVTWNCLNCWFFAYLSLFIIAFTLTIL